MYKNDKFIRILIILFSIQAIYFVLNLMSKGIDIYYLLNLINQNPVAEKFDSYWFHKTNIIYYSSIVIQLITLIPFIIWLYREYSNVHTFYLKDRLSYKPIWAIFSFVIPVFNFFAPYKILTEIVDGYKYNSKIDNIVLGHQQIKFWWISYLCFVIYNRYISIRQPKFAEDYLVNTYHYLIINLCGLISLIFLIWILTQLRFIIHHSNG